MKSEKRHNFQQNWDRLLVLAQQQSDKKLLTLLQNHAENKEYICRKLGVLTETDIARLRATYK